MMTSSTITRATRQEFGLWYEEQAGGAVERLLCAFSARIGRPVHPGQVAGALARTIDRFPECRTAFGLADDGVLMRVPGKAPPDTVLFGPEWSVPAAASVLAGEPMSSSTGPVLRIGVVSSTKGQIDHVVGVAHHVIWDGQSEGLFLATLAEEIGKQGPHGRLRPPPPSAPMAVPDQQWSSHAPGGLWNAVGAQARGHGVTPFAWIVGHFAAATATWYDHPVTPYIDVDLRVAEPAAAGRLGYFQSQRALGTIGVGVPGAVAARGVLADVGALVELALSGGLRPDREVAQPGALTCKFYMRHQQSDHGDLVAIDMALPVARNDLAVGMTATGDKAHLTVTARRGVHKPTDELGRYLMTTLFQAAAHNESRGDEDK